MHIILIFIDKRTRADLQYLSLFGRIRWRPLLVMQSLMNDEGGTSTGFVTINCHSSSILLSNYELTNSNSAENEH